MSLNVEILSSNLWISILFLVVISSNCVSLGKQSKGTSSGGWQRIPVKSSLFNNLPSSLNHEFQHVLRRYYPRKHNLQPSRLLSKLGKDFDVEWMALEKPNNNEASAFIVFDNHQTMDALLQQGILQYFNGTMGQSGNPQGMPDPWTISAMTEFLTKLSSCPVKFIWEDKGLLFWPRWVRKGVCVKTSSGCSWPPGMQCSPSLSTGIHLLRWQCVANNVHKRRKQKNRNSHVKGQVEKPLKKDKSQDKRVKCRWFKTTHNVLTQCSCKC